MTNKSLLTYTCSNSESLEVAAITKRLVIDYDPTEYLAFRQSCQLASRELPERLINWSDMVKKQKVGVVRNLPVESNLPPTPTMRFAMDAKSMFSDKIIGCISALFGTIYTFEGKQVPRHITNLYPIPDDFGTQLASSNTELEWHVEDGFHNGRSEWVGLLCLKGDPNVYLQLARASDLCLSAELTAFVRKPIFYLQVDDTFKAENITHVYTSILTGSHEDPDIVYDPAYTVCKNVTESEAISFVKDEADRNKLSFCLEKGDMLLFNNRKTIHSRTPYMPTLDGTDRWLKRTLIISDPTLVERLDNGFMPLEFL